MAASRGATEDLRIFNPVPLGLYPSNMRWPFSCVTETLWLTPPRWPPSSVTSAAVQHAPATTPLLPCHQWRRSRTVHGAAHLHRRQDHRHRQHADIRSDANIGTSWEPYVLDLSSALSGISSIVTDDNDDSAGGPSKALR